MGNPSTTLFTVLSFLVIDYCFLCVCVFLAQAWENMMSASSQSPNPNNPAEYCSTIPPLQQAQASGALNSPPPTVMVPVGVLKHPGAEGRGPFCVSPFFEKNTAHIQSKHYLPEPVVPFVNWSGSVNNYLGWDAENLISHLCSAKSFCSSHYASVFFNQYNVNSDLFHGAICAMTSVEYSSTLKV